MAETTDTCRATMSASSDTAQVTTVRRPFGTLLTVAAGASIVAGLLHYAAAAGHRSEWTIAAVLFTLVGAFQIVWAAWLWTEPRARVLLTGVLVNAVALAVWALSRTTGIPIGHDAGVAEPVGPLAAACVIAEAVVVGTVLLALRKKMVGPTREPEPYRLS